MRKVSVVDNRRVKLINLVSVLTLGLSLLAIAGGVIHLAVPVNIVMDNVLGVFFLLALAAVNLLIYLDDRAVEREDYLGRRLHRRGYLCLAAMIAGLPALAGLNMMVALIYTGRFNRLIYRGIYFIYFGILILGLALAWQNLAAARAGFPLRRGRLVSGRKSGGFGKKAVMALCYIILLAGSAALYFFLAGDRSFFAESGLQCIETLLSGYALFHAFILLSVAILLLKMQNRPGGAAALLTGALGMICFAAYLLPLLAMPGTISEAEAEFARVFGGSRPEHDELAAADYFLKTPFSLPAYFLGLPPGDYRYEKDILFYEGSGGVDDGLKLYFDVFMPPEDRTGLPGRGTTLVRIHGGAWITGDKGFANMMQVNKYFASRGYTVFDLQYGLTDRVNLTALQPLLARKELVGPFTLDDVVRHLGAFTQYLADHAVSYDLDLDSVFISGGSAGGQLTTAVALAAAGGKYPEIFSDQINIKGYLPLYPANQTGFLPVIGAAAEWIDVGLLVDKKSPPCLIYQGSSDGMVPPLTARKFKEKYQSAGNEQCAVLEMKWAGHASDFYFPGFYNQVWIYYMERFMALYR